MTSGGAPTRSKDSLADVVEMLLDKGVVINADIAVSVGDTELLGIQLRAAIASFETAAQYGLEFPDGTDMQRVAAVSGRGELDDERERDLSAPVVVDGPSEKGVAIDTETGNKSDPSVEADEADAEGDEAENTDGDAATGDNETETDDDTDVETDDESDDGNRTGNADAVESEDAEDDDD